MAYISVRVPLDVENTWIKNKQNDHYFFSSNKGFKNKQFAECLGGKQRVLTINTTTLKCWLINWFLGQSLWQCLNGGKSLKSKQSLISTLFSNFVLILWPANNTLSRQICVVKLITDLRALWSSPYSSLMLKKKQQQTISLVSFSSSTPLPRFQANYYLLFKEQRSTCFHLVIQFIWIDARFMNSS